MSVPALSAARTLCELRDWTISNLALQKILYLAHMFHLGQTGQPLISEPFEAWEYGPVVPSVYRRAKVFGNGPVQNVFHWVPPVKSGSTEYSALAEAAKQTKNMTSGRLVSITHWPKGAWATQYRPDMRGIAIPNSLILDEFRARTTAA